MSGSSLCSDAVVHPGRYVCRWAGYELEVEVRWFQGELGAVLPGGWHCPLRTTPDAVFVPVPEASNAGGGK